MMFLMEHAKGFKPLQGNILLILRGEMRYFWPQMEMRIMNEGWAAGLKVFEAGAFELGRKIEYHALFDKWK